MSARVTKPRPEALFFFDILGFRAWVKRAQRRPADPLSYVAAFLGQRENAHIVGAWGHRYALSDSVFLTHSDALKALDQACSFVSSLFYMDTDTPVLLRGAIAFGVVRHAPGVFLKKSRNLVGPAVVDAVEMEKESGLKGPRIFLREVLARRLSRKPGRAGWQLTPTSVAGIWEVLWMLPPRPDVFDADRMLDLKKYCAGAVTLLRRNGTHPDYGAHYRELMLLAARTTKRVEEFSARGKTNGLFTRKQFMSASAIMKTCSTMKGLPGGYVRELADILS